jgi:molecular chaperone GrpE
MKSKSSKDEEKIETVKEEEPTVLTPEEEIQKLKSEVEDYNEKFLRAVADFDNFRKRIDRDLESSLEGIKGINRLMSALMDSFNIKRFDPQGEQFDFRLHEALTTVEKEGVEPNTIVEVILSGYTLEGELLRPAKVVVSKGFEEEGEKIVVEGE